MKPISGSYPSKDSAFLQIEGKNSAAFYIQLMFWILFIFFFAVSKKMLAWVIWDHWCKIDVLGQDYAAAEPESEDIV